MNKKAFTLVELMGVITVLALISLLVAPTIINQIRNSKDKIDSVTEQLIFAATDLYLDNKENDYPKYNGSTYCITLKDLVEDGKLSSPVLDSNGDEISLDRMIEIKINKNNYNYSIVNFCNNDIKIESLVLSDNNITLEAGTSRTISVDIWPKNVTNNVLKWTSSDTSVATIKDGVVTAVAPGKAVITATTTDGSNINEIINVTVNLYLYTNGIMQSMNNCINEGICPSGTEVAVLVNDTETYTFYVISDTNNQLTLIMSENLVRGVKWIDATDYTNENNKDETPDTCSYTSCNDEGPVTAINKLDELTDDEWSNIPKREYTYSGIGHDGQSKKYEDITRTMRARMITYGEAEALKTANNGSLPSYLYTGSHWTSTALASDSNNALFVYYEGYLSFYRVDYGAGGIRPVIELSK